MLDRREILMTGAATAALAGFAPAAAAAAAANPAVSKNLNAAFDAFVNEQLDHAPETVTQLGLDTGKRAHQRSELNDRSLAEIARVQALTEDELKRLKAFDRNTLNAKDAISYDVVLYELQQQADAGRKYRYAGGNLQAPYVVSQLTGSYQSIPDFLDSQHPIADRADADAYMARLEAFARVLDQETERVKQDAGIGVIPPDFVLAATLTQMTHLRALPADGSILSQSVARRTKANSIPGNYGADATSVVSSKIYPALDRQIAALKALKAKATHEAGVWRLPDGASYYADSLTQSTTSTMSPDQVHNFGINLVRQISDQAGGIMRTQGLTKGTVGERLHAMYRDPKFRYPNTDAGKEKLIADLNKKVQDVRARLPKYFDVLPKADVVIARVPKYLEAGAPGGYYENPSLDGTRPGRYYINLRDTADIPSWSLPTLTFHESIPGHHLQGSIQQEANLPLIRKLTGFTAYVEGWALYAEQLAVEMGMYDHDPFGHIGQLHDALLRAVRLVVDTGIHAQKWSREQGIKYYVDAIGDPDAAAASEVDRYCVWPGQACAYMVGKVDIMRLRSFAQMSLGAKFDLRKFHDTVLLCGAVPMIVLGRLVKGYVAASGGPAM
ncbi:MAG TPA: DUF885 family protein [Rhizomicrobium sp.]|jgi:uncharacterized protein (DUF885 family)